MAGQPHRPPRRLPLQLQPDRQRESYFAELVPLVAQLEQLVEAELIPALPSLISEAGYLRDAQRLDNWSERLQQLLDRVAGELWRTWPTERLRRIARRIGEATSDFQRQQLLRQFKAGLGVDPILHEPRLADRIESFTHENVRLIQSIPSDLLDDLHGRIVHQVRRGGRAEELARDVRERYGVTQRRAKLIARDQVGKFYGSLNRERQQSMGVAGYVWRTMSDERVCDDCSPLDGQRFSWDDDPPNGHPGDCHPDDRCVAEPDLAGFWASL